MSIPVLYIRFPKFVAVATPPTRVNKRPAKKNGHRKTCEENTVGFFQRWVAAYIFRGLNIEMIALLCLLAMAPVWSASPPCNVPTLDGHLHFTSVTSRSVYRECVFDIEQWPLYIEVERYAGRNIDTDAWMNMSVQGNGSKPSPYLSIRQGHITFSGDMHGVPTVTMLEHSMWLVLDKEGDDIVVAFAPPESRYFGVLGKWPDTGATTLNISAYTKTGLEQVVRRIVHAPPQDDTRQVLQKTIRELERRIRVLEKEITSVHSVNEKQNNLHNNHYKTTWEHKRALTERVQELHDSIPHDVVESIRAQLFTFRWFLAVVLIVGMYVSWRMYKREQKLHRWTL